MGKSRLLQEVGDRATAAGFDVRWGFCLRGASLPFFPWLQVFATRPPTDITHPIGELENEALVSVDGGARPTSEDQRLIDLLERAERAAGRRPVVILLDDFQWADRAAWRLLELLARHAVRLPLLVVCACRDDLGEDPDAVAARDGWRAITGGDVGHRLVLPPLDLRESRALIDDLRPGGSRTSRPGAEDLRAIRVARGNPFFLLQLVDAQGRPTAVPLRDGTAPDLVRAADPVPQGLRDFVRERVARLRSDQLLLLQVGARLGSRFEPAVVAEILRRPRTRVVQECGDLSGRGWLFASVGSRSGAFSFAHDLLYEELADPTRSGAPRRLGLRIAAWWRRNRPEQTSELVRLLETAGADRAAYAVAAPALSAALRRPDLGEAERYLRCLARREPERPGRRNIIARRYLGAIDRLRRFTSIDYRPLLVELESFDPPAPERWVAAQYRIECDLATSHARAGRELQRLLQELSETPGFARWKRDPFWAYLRATDALLHQPFPVARRLYWSALRRLTGPDRAHERCRLHVLMGYQIRGHRSTRLAREAIASAQRERRRYRLPLHPTGDLVALLVATEAFCGGELRLAQERFRRAVDRFHRSGLVAFETASRHGLVLTHLELGEFDQATRELNVVRRLAFQLDRAPMAVAADAIEGVIAARQGRWAEAGRWWERATRRERRTDLPRWRTLLALWRARARAELGDRSEAERVVADRRLRTSIRTLSSDLRSEAELNLGRLYEIAGDPMAARRWLGRARRDAPDWTGRLASHVAEEAWAVRHGRPAIAHRAHRAAEAIAQRQRVTISALWPATVRELSATHSPARVTAAPPPPRRRLLIDGDAPAVFAGRFSETILAELHRQHADGRGGGLAVLPESAFVELLAAPRERFVRALLRLTARGYLARTRGRPPGQSRTVWLYSLTPAGEQVALGRARAPGTSAGPGRGTPPARPA